MPGFLTKIVFFLPIKYAVENTAFFRDLTPSHSIHTPLRKKGHANYLLFVYVEKNTVRSDQYREVYI